MEETIAAALDIGTTKISLTLAKLQQQSVQYDPAVEILSHAYTHSDSVVNGTVQNIDKLTTGIRHLVDEVEAQSQIQINTVNACIGTPLIQHATHYSNLVKEDKDGEISREDVEALCQDMHRMVMPVGYNILHVIPQTFVLDKEFEVSDPVGCCAVQLDGTFKVISVDALALKKLERGIAKAGIHLNQLLLQPLSSSASVLSNEEKQAGVCLIDIGGGTSDLVIFHENKIKHVASIPLGGHIVTQDLKNGLGILEEEAENIKVHMGKALLEAEDAQTVLAVPPIRSGEPKMIPAANIATIIEARVAEIFELVHKEILSSQIMIEAGIVLTGGGALLKNIDKLSALVCSQHTRIGYPNEKVNFQQFAIANNPRFAAGLGLAKESLLPSQYPWTREKVVSEKFDVKRAVRESKAVNSTSALNKFTHIIKRIVLDDVRYDYD